MKIHLNKAALTLIGTVISFIRPPYSFAHGIDERSGLGTGMTIVLSVLWIAIVLGIVFIVRRLIRSGAGKQPDREERDERNKKDLQ